MAKNKEVKKWITINGKHIPIFNGPVPAKTKTKSSEEDVDDIVEQMKAEYENGKLYDAEIPEVNDGNEPGPYTQMLKDKSIDEIAWEFANQAGVHIDKECRESTDPETLCMVMDTVADIKDKYKCCMLNIRNATDDMVSESPNAYAWMGQNGTMYLNPEYFSGMTKEQLEAKWGRNGERSTLRGYHPPSPYGARSIIAHELGHAVFNQYIQNIMNEKEDIREDFNGWCDHWNACHDFVGDEFATGQRESYISSPGYKKLVDTFDELGNELREDPFIIKRWGGKPNLSLLGLANINYGYSDAISEYAGTNYTEMMAEAFADVYDNGVNASYTSKFLYGRIIKEMKK